MERLLAVCVGGALGSGARYLVGLALVRHAAFPWATLAVNLVGSALLVLVLGAAARGWLGETWRLALATGFLGGLTTYSTFNAETLAFIERGEWRLALLYLGSTLVGGLAGGAAVSALLRR